MRIAKWSIAILWTLYVPSSSIPLIPRHDIAQEAQGQQLNYMNSASLSDTISSTINAERTRKRSINYSVVQVDGSNAAATGTTVIQTVTQSTNDTPPSTKTVLSTLIVSKTLSKEPEIVTTTQDITQAAETGPSTVTATMVVSNPTPSPVIETQSVTSICTESLITTVQAKPTTTSYYDDGLWHTFYPVKNFQPDWSTSTTITSASYAASAYSNSTYVAEKRSLETPNSHDFTKRIADSKDEESTGQIDSESPVAEGGDEIIARKLPDDLEIASWNITTS